jgi:DHA1 family tetracycline resistance protein-like MFS transporter
MRFAAIHFLYNLAHQSLATVFVLYSGYRYGWTPTDVGWALASVGVFFAIIQAGLVGRLVARFGEWRMLVTGLSCGAVGMAIYGIAPTGLLFAAGIPIMSMWGFYGPSAQGLMTRRVGPTEQGKLQGALSSIMGITGIVGPGLFTLTFSTAISTWKLWFLSEPRSCWRPRSCGWASSSPWGSDRGRPGSDQGQTQGQTTR